MKTSIEITEKARNTTFDECKIYGGVKNSSKNTIFKKTIIGIEQKFKEHPIIYGIVSTVVGGIILFFVVKFLENLAK